MSSSSRFRVLRPLGEGGVATVYEAVDESGTGERVALKRLRADTALLEGVRERFAREVALLGRLDHPNIARVIDAGVDSNGPYCAIELLDGEDLGQRLGREGRLPATEALQIACGVLRGLTAAHAEGIVHRDLKPDNIFLANDANGRVTPKILDFGFSKVESIASQTTPLPLTRAGTVLGTPHYIAPEQAQARDDVDARADVYSIGAILFECLSGRPPHIAPSYERVVLAVCTEAAPKLVSIMPGVNERVGEIVDRALEREPTCRFATAREMEHAIANVLGEDAPAELDGRAREVPASDRAGAIAPVTRRRWPFALAMLAVGMLFTFALLAVLDRCS